MRSAEIMVTAYVLAVCLLVPPIHSRYVKRSTESFECSRSSPCGWHVYRPSDRAPQYFVPSPCECPNGTQCISTEDDVSISAYVHRCRTAEAVSSSDDDS